VSLLIIAAFVAAVLLAAIPMRHPPTRLVYLSAYVVASLALIVTLRVSGLIELLILLITFGPGLLVALVRLHIARADRRAGKQ
jgi:hypothetical protein